MINESGLINDAFITDDSGQDTTGNGSLSDADIVKEAQLYIAKLTAEIFALAKERDEARRECDEVVAACRGTQMGEAAIASMWQYVREKVAIQAERDALAQRVAALEEVISLLPVYCEHLHHAKKDRHKIGDPCPVEQRINTIINTEAPDA